MKANTKLDNGNVYPFSDPFFLLLIFEAQAITSISTGKKLKTKQTNKQTKY